MKKFKLTKLAKNFAKNTSGNFVITTALAAPILFGGIAITVETSMVWRQQGIIQDALDASALATGKQLSKSTDDQVLTTYARNFFYANLHNKNIDLNRINFTFEFGENEEGTAKRIKLNAKYDYPEYISNILNGLKYMSPQDFNFDISSEVAAANRTIEVAIVVDNSGSMGNYTGGTYDTRMEKAKEAATNLTQSLFDLADISNKPDPVQISVIPFGASVNIGSTNRGENWMDMNGWSSIHHENLNWEATSKRGDDWRSYTAETLGFKGPQNGSLSSNNSTTTIDWLTRWTLFDALSTPWAGCVEMRPHPYHTTDDEPDDLAPDTLIVPMFAPDEPDRRNGTWNEDGHYKNNYLNDYRRAYSNSSTYNYYGSHYLNTYIPGEGYNYNNYTRQYWRENWTMKYNGHAKYSSSSNSTKAKKYNSSAGSNLGKYGPNYGCTTDAILPLTSEEQTVVDAIDDMDAGGYTNVQAGIVWGWRALSANKPFSHGRSYSTYENDKYIIVLTDGNNTMPSQSTYNDTLYGPWGYGAEDRVQVGITSNQTNVGAMNIHTATTCENIKAIMDADNEPAYKIFTIAYDVPNGSSVKSLLEGCASTKKDGSKYYYDVSGDALAGAMAAIGDEISDLRISK